MNFLKEVQNITKNAIVEELVERKLFQNKLISEFMKDAVPKTESDILALAHDGKEVWSKPFPLSDEYTSLKYRALVNHFLALGFRAFSKIDYQHNEIKVRIEW